MKQDITLQYRGRSDIVTLTALDGSTVMSPQSATKSELLQGRVKGASYDPKVGVVEYIGAGRKVLYTYVPDEDPMRFVHDWRLNGAALVKDQEYDGAKISDWAYFTSLAETLHKSCIWGLINKLGLKYHTALKFADTAVKSLKEDVLIMRGVNLDLPRSAEDDKNDLAITQKEASRSFYAMTS